jgi:BR serine/threonine kinase
MVLELASHGELFDFLITKRRLQLDLACMFFREIIYGLEYIHSHGICHRDLKPENILLDDFNHVKIADFGFARWMRANIADTSCGSPHYAAPEVIKGLRYDGRGADIWSCGVILFALVAGRLPFDDPSIRTLLTKVKTGRYAMPDAFTPDLKDLISRMLELDVDRRIKLDQIKEHPIFRYGLNPAYILPSPLPIPVIPEEIDVENVSADLLTILKSIGYDSDEDIIGELRSPVHSNAKIFYQMFLEKMTGAGFLEGLPWQGGSGPEHPADLFYKQAEHFADRDGKFSAGDPFYRRRHFPDIQSPDVTSLAAKADWGVVETPEIEPVVIDAVPGPLVDVALRIQAFFKESGFQWFHQSDLEFLAKQEPGTLVVKIELRYTADDLLAVIVMQKAGSPDALHQFMANLGTWVTTTATE